MSLLALFDSKKWFIDINQQIDSPLFRFTLCCRVVTSAKLSEQWIIYLGVTSVTYLHCILSFTVYAGGATCGVINQRIRSQQTRDIHPMLVQCWASVAGGKPTLSNIGSTPRVCWDTAPQSQRQYLFTCKVNRYCFLTLHGSMMIATNIIILWSPSKSEINVTGKSYPPHEPNKTETFINMSKVWMNNGMNELNWNEWMNEWMNEWINDWMNTGLV